MAAASGTRGAWQDWERLAEALEMTSKKDLEDFVESRLFAPFYLELYENVIRPSQEEAQRTRQQRTHGPALRTVQLALIQGEKPGLRKFAARLPDKSDWTVKDHYAYFLLNVRDENVNDINGIFYGKGLSETTVDTRIWWLLQRLAFDVSPSRQKGSLGWRLVTGARKSEPKKPRTDNPVEPTPDNQEAEPDVIELTEVPHSAVFRPERPFLNPRDRDPAAHSPEIKQERQEDPGADDEVVIVRTSPAVAADVDSLSNYDRMVEERRSTVIDVNERYWRKYVMDKVAKEQGGWQAVVNSIPRQFTNNRWTSALSVTWESEVRKLNEQQGVAYMPLSARAIESFDQQQKLIDNKDYQRENVEEACQNLGIENSNIPRIPGMPRSCILKPWQHVAINAIREIRASDLRGCVESDVVGLGKTWITLGYILTCINERNALPEAVRMPAKPFMIVVPVKLVDQWIGEIQRIIPGVTVYKYHGDKRAKPIGREIIIDKNLTKNHSLFNGSPENASIVIITTYGTLTHRHGVRAQYQWRCTHGRWNKEAAKKHNKDYDELWPSGIAGYLDTVILDEAHIIKNTETDINTAVSWLKAPFHLFLSATPLLAGAKDFGGYLRFIEPANAAALWSAENLANWDLDEEVNPFVLDEDHPGSILCMTTRAADEFIFKYGIAPPLQGARLRRIWKQCLIRRTYASRVPFDNPKTIGDSLPRVKSTVFETEFSATEKAIYDRETSSLLTKLVYTDEKTKRPRWSFGVLRKLTLACLWTDFHYIEAKVKASTMKVWANDPNLAWRWLKMLEGVKLGFICPPQNDRVSLLACLCDGSPKLRLLLHNLGETVVRDEQKNLIWAMYPATQLFIFAALKLLNINVHLFASYMTEKDQRDVLENFTTERKGIMVLIGSYMLGAVGLNLQPLCWNVTLFDTPPSQPIGLQAVGRVRRIGNPSKVVYVTEYYVKNTFNDRLNELNVKKALPGIMAELNMALFRGGGEAADDNVYDEDVDLGSWVMDNGELVKAQADQVVGRGLPLLDAQQILRHILSIMRGHTVAV